MTGVDRAFARWPNVFAEHGTTVDDLLDEDRARRGCLLQRATAGPR